MKFRGIRATLREKKINARTLRLFQEFLEEMFIADDEQDAAYLPAWFVRLIVESQTLEEVAAKIADLDLEEENLSSALKTEIAWYKEAIKREQHSYYYHQNMNPWVRLADKIRYRMHLKRGDFEVLRETLKEVLQPVDSTWILLTADVHQVQDK